MYVIITNLIIKLKILIFLLTLLKFINIMNISIDNINVIERKINEYE